MQESPLVPGDATSSEPLSRLGLDPARPFYDLNLAGAQGVPSPQTLVQANSTPPALLLPDFGTQDYEVPAVQPYDLTGPGITYVPEFAADPALPALGEYAHPYDLDISTQGMSVNPQLEHDIPTPTDIAASLYPGLGFSTLEVHSAVTDTDPSVPDLQHPDLTLQVQMAPDERPGNLSTAALDVLHSTGSYQQAAEATYPASWMDQRGVNSTRTRHMSLLDDGLEV
jgi:hypothetical protein